MGPGRPAGWVPCTWGRVAGGIVRDARSGRLAPTWGLPEETASLVAPRVTPSLPGQAGGACLLESERK